MIITTCVFLIILTSQHVHCKVITINTTGGSDSDKCCMKGECPCSSLSTALQSMTSNTVINITSKSVTLHSKIIMESDHLHNITVTSNGATIMCNNKGNIKCVDCSNIIIEGITWDRCGFDENAGIIFKRTANVTIKNCTFQLVDIFLFSITENVIFDQCNFLSNKTDTQYRLLIDSTANSTANLTIHLIVLLLWTWFVITELYSNLSSLEYYNITNNILLQ